MKQAADCLPRLFILEAARHVTGGFMAVRRQALLLAGRVDCIIVLPDDTTLTDEDLAPFREVVRLPMKGLRRTIGAVAGYPLATLRSAWQLARVLRSTPGARLQVNDYFLLEGAATRLFGYAGPIVTWVRIDPANFGGPVAGAWLSAARLASNRIVVVSRFIKQRLPRGLGAELLYDPVPDVPLAGRAKGLRLVFVGNYIEGKGQDLAIRAFHCIAADFPEATLLLHGGDMGLEANRRYRASLEVLASAGPGAGRITLGGFAENTGAVLDGAVAALCLSRSETFSLTCQEASARGLAVIATRCGGPEEIVEHGRTGWLVDVGDEQATASAMAEALANPRRTVRMGLQGAALVREKFSPEQFCKSLTDLFDLPLNGGTPVNGVDV